MRAAALLACLTLSACQCAQVPEDVCLIGECDAGVAGGGRGGGSGTGGGAATGGGGGSEVGGGSGGGGGGNQGGGGGGGAVTGGGSGGGDGGVVVIRIPFCDDWSCVSPRIPAREAQAPTFDLQTLPFSEPLNLPADCNAAFFGGVLMPDDTVLAIPNCANRFVLIDVEGRSTRAIGPVLPDVFTVGPDGGPSRVTRFGGGVLDCDGSAIILPLGQEGGYRVRLDGGVEPLSLPGRTIGGVLSGPCTNATLTYGDFGGGTDAGSLLLGVPVDGGMAQRYPIDGYVPGGFGRSRFGDGWGLRRGRSALIFYSLELVGPLNNGVPGQLTLVSASQSPFPAQGVGLSTRGAFYALNSARGDIVFREATGGNSTQANGAGVPSQPLRYPVTRGDGFIYAVNTDGLWIYDEARVQLPRRVPIPSIAGLIEPVAGLVVHPSGVMVGIPSQIPGVLLFVPDGGVTMPREVLRSPYFNKL